MFDKITIAPTQTETRLVPYCVEEKRAPTDESIRLLNEMTEKARSNIIYNKVLTDNGFTFDIYINRVPTSLDYRVTIRYSLNSKDHTVDFILDDSLSLEEKANRITQELAKSIAVQIICTKAGSIFDSFRRLI